MSFILELFIRCWRVYNKMERADTIKLFVLFSFFFQRFFLGMWICTKVFRGNFKPAIARLQPLQKCQWIRPKIKCINKLMGCRLPIVTWGQWADKGDSRKVNSILVYLVCLLAYFLIQLEATLSLVRCLENLDNFITNTENALFVFICEASRCINIQQHRFCKTLTTIRFV